MSREREKKVVELDESFCFWAKWAHSWYKWGGGEKEEGDEEVGEKGGTEGLIFLKKKYFIIIFS